MININNIIKAILLSSNGKMLTIADFTSALPDLERDVIARALEELLVAGGDVYDIIKVKDHYYVQTKQNYVEYIKRVNQASEDPRQRKALIETLAVIAMHQPVSRSEIEAIRCVQLNLSILHDLQDYGWVKVVKVMANDTHLYGTTLEFLRYFGLSSVSEFERKLLPENISQD
jgi:segregation and condensation protein B